MEAVADHDFVATARDELSFKKGQVLKTAAAKAVSLVALSRNVIATPSMFLTPLIVDAICRRSSWFKNNLKYLNIPVQLGLVFVLSLDVATMRYFEPENYEKFKAMGIKTVYFNKGL
ncbi:hypothetical protein QR680_001679 [Steinernema hermaphroditum]|uniref:Uncharacterized protein n=1 Tax=Steinernema hermaphroditum TaxID=289476 RepID=A0AA39H262_9BILA|nr:hypothetical protein QR680_001679 [Steinernema hermaphroditum]